MDLEFVTQFFVAELVVYLRVCIYTCYMNEYKLHYEVTQPPMGTGGSNLGGTAAGAWSYTSIPNIRRHGVVLRVPGTSTPKIRLHDVVLS